MSARPDRIADRRVKVLNDCELTLPSLVLRLPLLAVFVLLSSFVFVPNLSAQGGNAANLQNLIEGLDRLSEQGGGGASLLRQPGEVLDDTREDAARRIGAPISSQEAGAGPTRVRDQLNPAQLTLARRFCEGNLPAELEDSLAGIAAFSALEKDYCKRAKMLLTQYGYTIFGGLAGARPLSTGAILDTYVLGPGDELVISFRGAKNLTQPVSVDREGRVILSDLRPIQAGETEFGKFRDRLEAAVQEAFIGVDVFVSLGATRIANVLVAGEVASPGIHQVSGLSSVLDAIGLAGGILKTGSLRRVYLIRGGKRLEIDFYALLMSGASVADFALRDGDRIVVPPIGPTIAIAGDVKREGIYELLADFPHAAVDLVAFAGGPLRPVGNRFSSVHLAENGEQIVGESSSLDFTLSSGDILIVGRRSATERGGVFLDGHVRVPGRRAIGSAPTLSKLLGETNDLLPDPYLLAGVLETTDAATGARRLFAVNLTRLLSGQEDYSLIEGDRLIILSGEDIRYLSGPEVQEVLRRGFGDSNSPIGDDDGNQGPPTGLQESSSNSLDTIVRQVNGGISVARPGGIGASQETAADGKINDPFVRAGLSPCSGVRALENVVTSSRQARFASAVVTFGSTSSDQFRDLSLSRCRPIFDANPDLLPFLLEHAVQLLGEVRREGAFPVTPGTGLDSLVSVSGGLSREVDISKVELSRFQSDPNVRDAIDLTDQDLSTILINPGDIVRFGSVFRDREVGQVRLVGEFVRPGNYSIRRGERLSQLLARAGGLTAQAYPIGGVFTRESVKRAEEVALARLARELNAAVTVAAARRSIDPSAITAFAELTRDVGSTPATGRVVMEADPTVLSVRPELDIVLEPGDRLFMPKRPNSVLVTGDVLNPGAMQFLSGADVDDYIGRAGGFQQSADRARIFVVLPNGAARPVSVSPFNYTRINIPPGSAIVVPKDASPFDPFTFAKDLSTLISQLAITAASLAVISD